MAEELVKRLIELFENQIKITKEIVAMLQGPEAEAPAAAEKKPGKKGAKKDEPKPDEEKTPEGAKLAKDVTGEDLRAALNDYSEMFGMPRTLALNQKLGGSKKFSGIKEEFYSLIYGTAIADLDRKVSSVDDKGPEASYKPPEKAADPSPSKVPEKKADAVSGTDGMTYDKLRPIAGKFLEDQGEPALQALLVAFKAGRGEDGKPKLSKLDPSKYGAFVEACQNV